MVLVRERACPVPMRPSFYGMSSPQSLILLRKAVRLPRARRKERTFHGLAQRGT